MVAVVQSHNESLERATLSTRSVGTLNLIQASLSSKKVARQSPLLAGIHRTVDGTLVGVLIAVAFVASFTLHWQHRWTVAFTRLEKTRALAHRLTESTAMLERYLLQKNSSPRSMVPTKASHLLYLKRPNVEKNSIEIPILRELVDQPINQGY